MLWFQVQVLVGPPVSLCELCRCAFGTLPSVALARLVANASVIWVCFEYVDIETAPLRLYIRRAGIHHDHHQNLLVNVNSSNLVGHRFLQAGKRQEACTQKSDTVTCYQPAPN